MKFLRKIFVIAAALLVVCHGRAADVFGAATHVPTSIELHDQYDAPQKLSFPTTNVTVLTIADKKGSEQIDGWVVELKKRYAGHIALSGIAEVGGVPSLMQGMVRKKFQKLHTYPVMMDWSGVVVKHFNPQKDCANVFVIDAQGRILKRFSGAAGEESLRELYEAIDHALSPAAPVKR